MRSAAAIAAAGAAALGACAWGPGEPMGAVTVRLEAAWALRADRGPGPWQRLASDLEVRVDAAAAELGALALVDVGAGALGFDPANPPPGYTLCHDGHCHAADGRLVPYEEIAAELAGGAGPARVLALDAGARDLAAGEAVTLTCDGAPCDLPRARIGRVELEVDALALAGWVRDRRDPPRFEGELPWTLALAAPVTVTGPIELPVDRAHPPAIALTVRFAPSAALLDAVDLAAADPDPSPLADALGELALDPAADRR